MKQTGIIFAAALSLLATGCKTTEEAKPVSWKDQQAYISKSRDPRIYGLSIYQTPGGGTEIRGGSRLHQKQVEILPMQVEKPLRTVVNIRTGIGQEHPVLLDFTERNNWFGFDLAKKVGAMPLGEGKAQLVKRSGEEFASCLSIVQSLRLNQLYIETPLLYVRMANGTIGTLAREIKKPEPEGVIGWDTLSKFEQIRIDYAGKKIFLFTTEPYTPNPDLVALQTPLIKNAGACAIRGVIDGKERLILIDPAGDFEIATDNGTPVRTLFLEDIEFKNPVTTKSPGGSRLGAKFFSKYQVVICPLKGNFYFEKNELK